MVAKTATMAIVVEVRTTAAVVDKEVAVAHAPTTRDLATMITLMVRNSRRSSIMVVEEVVVEVVSPSVIRRTSTAATIVTVVLLTRLCVVITLRTDMDKVMVADRSLPSLSGLVASTPASKRCQ